MRIKIPRKIRIDIEKTKNVFSIIGFTLFVLITLTGLVFGIRYIRYKSFFEERELQCQVFTQYLTEEVLPLTEANVSDCTCHYTNQDVGEGITSNCLCSCKLYDADGNLIDDDWNPLFSTI